MLKGKRSKEQGLMASKEREIQNIKGDLSLNLEKIPGISGTARVLTVEKV
ncbi:MAG: hypothetical protein ACOX6G_02170 [Christensenellales bacterium]|jgi:hypothetical protein|nr:hypothetical protein [Clostridiales bacterium]